MMTIGEVHVSIVLQCEYTVGVRLSDDQNSDIANLQNVELMICEFNFPNACI